MVHDIVLYPDPRLKKKSAEVPASALDEHQKLFDDMVETMYAADGVGLAAPQIGVNLRIAVIDTSPRQEGEKLRFFINPEIVSHSETRVPYVEGCLSIPGEAEEVQRWETVKVRALGRDGKSFELDATELLAIAVQHEIDHLDGLLFIDRLSTLKRELIKRRIRKQRAMDAAERKAAAEKARPNAHESAL
jgi:peptide deformylase